MSRSRSLGSALVLLALCACSNPEREKKEQEAAAAEKKLAEAKAHRESLEQERTKLTGQIAETRAQADAANSAYHRTLAAGAYLAEAEGSELKPDDVMQANLKAARSGFLLEEATRKKDSKELLALATGLLDSERPCVEVKKEEAPEQQAEAQAEEPEESSDCGPCEAKPYEDVCEGVPARLSLWPAWTCESVASTADTLPAAAFCTASFEYPEPTSAGSSTYAQDDLPTTQEVVRIVYEYQGHLYASDFPSPTDELYHPPNTTGLATCAAETEKNSCLHQCDVQFDRYEDPCACDPTPDHHDDEGGCGCGDGEEDEPDETPEVREARLAAEAAEAAVEEAKREAELAAKELEFQQCRAACEPEQPEEPATTDEDGNPLPPTPAAVSRRAWLEASPAPGHFVVTVQTRKLSDDDKELESSLTTYVLEHRPLTALWRGGSAADSADVLTPLHTQFEFEEVLRKDDALVLDPLPGMKGPMLVGLSNGTVQAVRFSHEKGDDAEPVQALDENEVCEALKKEPKRFPAAYLEACEPAAPAVAAPEGSDAGTEGKVAGEVTP
ncbi:hypothetical protein HPC49_02945 [Pyxidicoccus fallax]|uniref:Lipoprotein n=1 Tax=Pyxidicoccus fallax TaxID=394095 RepID=A0A848LAU7_9BACT|nr:hypothetical protein [Pyxidicoccus fallax]NMO15616.1 hypothetical protein [Pyxidicoccus fallax]NPC77213.1 hypothetical protein [Pyxidicoccus fallax]